MPGQYSNLCVTVPDSSTVVQVLTDLGGTAHLKPLYEDTDGPSYEFLRGVVVQAHCQAWCLFRDQEAVAAIWYQCAGERADMIDLRVLASSRRQGLGKELLRASLTALDGVAAVDLEVRESNLAAQALYRTMGFAETGRRPNYYATASGREHAILMSLELTLDEVSS
jgi:ribosomal protein S18 acetylase RimI-like enzyme